MKFIHVFCLGLLAWAIIIPVVEYYEGGFMTALAVIGLVVYCCLSGVYWEC